MIGAAFAKLVLSDISYQVSSLAFLRTSCTVPTLLQRRFFQSSLIKERGDSKRGNKKRHTTNKNGNSISLNNKRQHWVNDIMNSTKDETSTSEDSMSKLFKPVTIKPNPDDLNLGSEIAGKIERSKLIKTLNSFFQSQKTKTLSREQGLDDYLYDQACISFRKYTMDVTLLPPDLYILLSDILQGAIHEDSIFPYFLTHAKRVFPHLECLDELKLISDLSDPPMWYPDARSMKRKIIFHSGPTNSGKTYHAMERFLSADSGVYCGPLKLLAVEVFQKANARGTVCDLVTGEERRCMDPEGKPSAHVACTVEMTNVNQTYEVAVLDEIQMVKDYQRGWAWTRALLGIPAKEIHVCGEAAAINLIREVALSIGEEFEVKSYKRLTQLVIQDRAVESLQNVMPGDCIVCFNKQDIYSVSRGLERLGKEAAVIYGSLPPNTKLAMSQRFNDPEDPCKVMVATDAIGMGLNLNIRRIIFYSMFKLQQLDNGDKEIQPLSVSQALQIAGRGGRYNTQWETGYVTTFNQDHIPVMHELLSQTPDNITHAGLHPTFDQIELYAYHLPHATLSNLIDIFTSLSVMDHSLYTLCLMDDFKFLANMIEHIKLPLKAKYTFCCAPINRNMPFVCTMYLKIVRQYSKGELITFDWLCHQMGWPWKLPDTILDLMQLEANHDVLDLYLWLSYRFPDMFPDVELIRSVQQELDEIIRDGVTNLVQLLRNTDAGTTSLTTKKALKVETEEMGIDDDKVGSLVQAMISKPNKKRVKNHENKNSMDVKSEEVEDQGKNKKSPNNGSRRHKKKESENNIAVEDLDKYVKKSMKKGMSKRLTQRLIDKGLMKSPMMKDLKGEWKP